MKKEHTRKQLEFLFSPGDVWEVCCLKSKVTKHQIWDNEFAGRGIIAGWYNDIDKAVADVSRLEEEVKPEGIYFTVNPCKYELLARANNRLKVVQSRTSDEHIARIENFFIDIDPIKPAGISSSITELSYALDKALLMREELSSLGPHLFALSGNGYHLVFKAHGATTAEIEKLLKALSKKYSDDLIGVDVSVFNPARLVKSYGTTARKGDELKDSNAREHRLAVVKD